jgi:hypothetical protein
VWTPSGESIEGEAVRIVPVGDHAWQVRMAGEGRLKSIHPPDAALMPVDPEVIADAHRPAEDIGLRSVGVDDMVASDAGRYLLEVNRVPNVTVRDRNGGPDQGRSSSVQPLMASRFWTPLLRRVRRGGIFLLALPSDPRYDIP